MAQGKRRVSYVIPPPPDTDAVPPLSLPPHATPRLGTIAPLLLPLHGQHDPQDLVHHHSHAHSHYHSRRPRHRLGVASLALDMSTQLAGKSSPEGILYTGGRDGLVISWDLGISTKRRAQHDLDSAKQRAGKWEVLTGWADDMIDEEGEDDEARLGGDGDVLGDVNYPRRERKDSAVAQLPYEQLWELDSAATKPGVRSHFRQCAEAHSDWVSDIALCNYNQTLVSASSDGTVKAWNPHSASHQEENEENEHSSNFIEPTQIGSHSDYVRCLTYCRERNWIASGSFDRTIKLWDLSISSHTSPTTAKSKSNPVVTLTPPDVASPKSSVYALACDPHGRTIASGSPERVVRLWDPRSGKRTGKLVGHTDNIRAILISEDTKYLLTGSADASVKLWSLTSQRCLHTFTHHTDSVWSLFSTHPSLEVFYSGDRSGLVCRIDVEGCADVGDGECIVLCQDSESASVQPPTDVGTTGEAKADGNVSHGRGTGNGRGSATSEGVNKILVMDDQLLWTASGTSSVRRWRIPPRRAARVIPMPNISVDMDGERIPFVPDSPTVQRRHDIRPPSPSLRSSPSTLQQQHGQFHHTQNLSLPSPRTSFATASVTSFTSDLEPAPSSSSHHQLHHHPSLPRSSNGGIEDGDKLNGIPMDSLVKLVSANDPFSTSYSYSYASYPSRARDPEVATLYSAASVMSVPRMSVGVYPPKSPTQNILNQQQQAQQAQQQHQLQHSSSIHGLQSSRTDDTLPHSHSHSISSPHHSHSHSHTPIPHHSSSLSHPHSHSSHHQLQLQQLQQQIQQQHQASTARTNYEERDLATDAIPLLSTPEHVIKGDHGLVRSVILNDRIHVLTVDTSGEVKVWDIVRGVCKGRFAREEVYAASRGGSVSGRSGNHRAGGGGGGGGGGEHEVERSPREALEVVRERIEGEAVVQSWCSPDTKAGVLVVHIGEKCFEAEVYADEVGLLGDKRLGEEAKLNIGKWVLRNLFIGFIREEQRIRRRSSGLSESDVGAGGLLAPSLGRSPPPPFTPVPLGARTSTDSTQLPSPASHHSHNNSYSSKNGSNSRRTSASSSSLERTTKKLTTSTTTHRHSGSQIVTYSSKMIPALVLNVPDAPRSLPLATPLIPLNTKDGHFTPPSSEGTGPGRKDILAAEVVTPTLGSGSNSNTMTPIVGQGDQFTTPRIRQMSLQGPAVAAAIEEASTATATATATAVAVTVTNTVTTPTTTTSGTNTVTTPKPETQNSLSASGLMGRLRNLGRSSASKRPMSDGSGGVVVSSSPVLGGGVVPPSSVENTVVVETTNVVPENTKTLAQLLLSGPLSPPTSQDAPIHYMPPNTTLLISEEATPSFNVVWRGSTGTTHLDVQALEEVMPMWLMDYLLINKLPANMGTGGALPKISFVLMPWNREPDVYEALPELLNTQQSKLTANRNLRIRKIAIHVHEKLEKIKNGSGAPSVRSSVDGNGTNGSHSRNNSARNVTTATNAITTNSSSNNVPSTTASLHSLGGSHSHSKPEEEYEILCNETLLPLTMTLAAVKQYVWKQSSELVMHYRRKIPVPVPVTTTTTNGGTTMKSSR